MAGRWPHPLAADSLRQARGPFRTRVGTGQARLYCSGKSWRLSLRPLADAFALTGPAGQSCRVRWARVRTGVVCHGGTRLTHSRVRLSWTAAEHRLGVRSLIQAQGAGALPVRIVDTLLGLSLGPGRSSPTARLGWCRARVGLSSAWQSGRADAQQHPLRVSSGSASVRPGPAQAPGLVGLQAPGSQPRGRWRVATCFVAAATLWWSLVSAKVVLRVSEVLWGSLILLHFLVHI
jgi:hypothetical protein